MKQVRLTEEFTYNPPGKRGISVHYKTPGKTYDKVPEAHAAAIVEAGAGEIIDANTAGDDGDLLTEESGTEEGEDVGSW